MKFRSSPPGKKQAVSGCPVLKLFHQTLFDFVRGRLTLLVLAVIAPAALMAGGLMVQTYRKERRAVEDRLHATARSLSLLVDAQMSERVALLRGLSTSPFLQDGGSREFYLQAKTVKTSEEEWIVLRSPEGQQLINTLFPWGTKLPVVNVDPGFLRVEGRGEPYVSNLINGAATGRKVFIVAVPISETGAFAIHFISWRPLQFRDRRWFRAAYPMDGLQPW